MKSQTVRFGLILGAICLMATLVLAVTYEVTKPQIERQAKMEEDRALKQIMPEADSFTPKTAGTFGYYEASRAGVPIGYCLRVTGSGYSGYIRMMVAFDPSGIIKGVRVLEHSETPGLGSKISDVRPGESQPAFLRQFAGKPARSLAVRQNIDAITGATISSKAVVDSVRGTVGAFLEAVAQ